MNLPNLTRIAARRLWREWLRPLALPFLFITAAKSALADINYVPSGSMQPTILCGDVVFINKLAYDLRVPFTTARLTRWSDPARGDIVVCFAPDDGTRLVKRVAALPGDTIELRDDALFLNGTRQSYTPLAADAPGVRDLEPTERNASLFVRESLTTHASCAPRVHATQFLPAQPAPLNSAPSPCRLDTTSCWEIPATTAAIRAISVSCLAPKSSAKPKPSSPPPTSGTGCARASTASSPSSTERAHSP